MVIDSSGSIQGAGAHNGRANLVEGVILANLVVLRAELIVPTEIC